VPRAQKRVGKKYAHQQEPRTPIDRDDGIKALVTVHPPTCCGCPMRTPGRGIPSLRRWICRLSRDFAKIGERGEPEFVILSGEF